MNLAGHKLGMNWHTVEHPDYSDADLIQAERMAKSYIADGSQHLYESGKRMLQSIKEIREKRAEANQKAWDREMNITWPGSWPNEAMPESKVLRVIEAIERTLAGKKWHFHCKGRSPEDGVAFVCNTIREFMPDVDIPYVGKRMISVRRTGDRHVLSVTFHANHAKAVDINLRLVEI